MKATTLNLFDTAFLARSSVNPGSFLPTRWYDAATIGQNNGSIVSNTTPWEDQSPNGDDAFASAGNEPTYQTNVINGRPTVRFVDEERMLFEGGDLVLDAFTILCVLLSASDSTYVSRGGFNRQIRINRLSQARASWFSGATGQELVSNLYTSNANLARMVGHRRTALMPGHAFMFFDNANEVTPTTGGVDSSLFGINQLGVLPSEFATPLSCDIAEIVIYNTALSTQNIQALYTHYFKPKFALP